MYRLRVALARIKSLEREKDERLHKIKAEVGFPISICLLSSATLNPCACPWLVPLARTLRRNLGLRRCMRTACSCSGRRIAVMPTQWRLTLSSSSPTALVVSANPLFTAPNAAPLLATAGSGPAYRVAGAGARRPPRRCGGGGGRVQRRGGGGRAAATAARAC